MNIINFNNNQVKLEGNLHVITNMALEELRVVMPSGECTIPHSGFDRCCLTKSASQTIPVGTGWTDVTWDGDDYDTNNLYSVSVFPKIITIKRTGYYVFSYKHRIQSVDKFSCDSRLIKNGTIDIPRSGKTKTGSKDASTITPNDITPIIYFTAGDFVKLQTRHDYNQSKDILPADSFFACERKY